MAKISLTDITAGHGSTTTQANNNTLLENAIENTLSLDGTSPNAMNAQLDMNSNRIVNLPNATNNTEPVTLAQAASIQSFTGVVATAGAVGAVLWPITAAETAAGVTPVSYEYEPGNVLRYGTNSNPGTTNMTTVIQDALDSSKDVYVPEGTYLVTEDTLTMQNGGRIRGQGTIKCSVSSAASTGSHSHAMIIVTKNNTVEGLTFLGSGNNAYAVGGFSDATNDCDDILVRGLDCTECGIFTAEPYDGFTFNRYDETADVWYTTGQVTSVHKGQRIKVVDCTMRGDTTYALATTNTNNAKVAGVSFLYCTDASASNIRVSNARFGAWSYGGAPKNSGNTDLSTITNNANRIRFSNIIATDCYSAAWMSNTDDGTIIGCCAEDCEDVQFDFEGCARCVCTGCTVTDTTGSGGALTALNGCSNITFANNVVSTDKTASYILCRDGCSNITWQNNILISTDGATKTSIKVWNALSGLATAQSNIRILNNTFTDFRVDAQVVNGITIRGNNHSGFGDDNILTCTDCDKATISDNIIRFDSAYAVATAAGSPIQVLDGSSTLSHTETVVCNNQVQDCSSTTGIYIFISAETSPQNDIKCIGNIANNIFFNDSFVNTPANGTKGRVVAFNNYSTISDVEHTPASTISRTAPASEKFNPTIMYGGTGIGSLAGTYKVGDVIYRTTPTAGGTMGWVCTAAGTPGTWKTFGAVTA